MGPLNRDWRGGNSRKCCVEVETQRPKTRVSQLKRRLRKRGVTVGLLDRGWRGGNSPRFCVEVGTHRPDACVSAVGKAEESDVLRWDFCIVGGEVETLANLWV